MIKIVAMNYVLEDQKENFIQLTKSLIEESRKEEGCISYSLYQDISNSNVLTFIEEWKSKEAIDFHNQTSHFTRVVPQLGALCEKDGDVKLYEEIK